MKAQVLELVEPQILEEIQIQSYIQMAKALSHVNNIGVKIIDLELNEILFVSQNPAYTCIDNPELVRRMGFSYYNSFVSKELQEKISIIKNCYSFFEKIEIEERLSYSIKLNYVLNIEEKQIPVCAKIMPLTLSEKGLPKYCIAITILSPYRNETIAEIRKLHSSEYWVFDLNCKKWFEKRDVELSPKERDVLYHSSKGLSVDEIANLMGKSKNTINSYKKNIFDKLEVSTISEAVSKAYGSKI
jgi:DNA-binding CsgD family transcriptional regulator